MSGNQRSKLESLPVQVICAEWGPEPTRIMLRGVVEGQRKSMPGTRNHDRTTHRHR